MTDLKAAVVGTGFIGPVHVEGLRRLGVDVVGILGSSEQKSCDAAKTLGLPVAYRTLSELLGDPAVDVVHLTSPNRFHFQQASAVLEAGKHVLCEKPLAMNGRESARLVELAAESGVAAGVNYNVRYYPMCQEAAQQRREGKLGRLFHVGGSYVQDWLFHPTDFSWRVQPEEGGAPRAVADIGTHWLDLIQFITGRRVTSVCADLETVYPERIRPAGGSQTFSATSAAASAGEKVSITTEDCGNLMFRFDDGSSGTCWVSQVTAGRKNCLRFEIAGANQSWAWCSESPNQLWIGHRDRPSEAMVRDPSLLSAAAAGVCSYPGGHNEGFGDTFKQLFRDFYTAIETDGYRDHPAYPTFTDGHHEVLICEAVLKSHRQRRWVDVGESDS